MINGCVNVKGFVCNYPAGVHRLDRVTSGVLIFAKTQKKADELRSLISSRQVEKEYLCRVEGEFPRYFIIYCSVNTQMKIMINSKNHLLSKLNICAVLYLQGIYNL